MALTTLTIVSTLLNATCDVRASATDCCDGPYVDMCILSDSTTADPLVWQWEPRHTCSQFQGHFPSVDACRPFRYDMYKHIDTACAKLQLHGAGAVGTLTRSDGAILPTSTALGDAHAGTELKFCMFHRKQLSMTTCSGRLSLLDGVAEANIAGAYCMEPDKTTRPQPHLTLRDVDNHSLLKKAQIEALVFFAAIAAIVSLAVSAGLHTRVSRRGTATPSSASRLNVFHAAFYSNVNDDSGGKFM